MKETQAIELYRLPISEAYRNGNEIVWPLADSDTWKAIGMLTHFVNGAQSIFGEQVKLKANECTNGSNVSLVISAHIEELQLELTPHIKNTVIEIFSHAHEVLQQIEQSDVPAAHIAIHTGNPAYSSSSEIYAEGPVAELAQVLRENLPAGIQIGAAIDVTDRASITPKRGISARIQEDTDEIIVAEILHVCDHSRTALVKASKKNIKLTFPPELRTALLTAQADYLTTQLRIRRDYKLHNGIKKDSGSAIIEIIATASNPQQQKLNIVD